MWGYVRFLERFFVVVLYISYFLNENILIRLVIILDIICLVDLF